MLILKKKVCILGAFGVGKTSLMRRFVSGVFSEKYLSTIGVKIDHKNVRVGKAEVCLVIWDIAGGLDESRHVPSYLRGLSGSIIVGDGTRPETCRLAPDLVHFVEDHADSRPNIFLLNKVDLGENWGLNPEDEFRIGQSVGSFIKTSAKTGESVNEAFTRLAADMIGVHAHGLESD